jgi:3-hydroxyacyl-[acyl-carrier-protein] dehydratase
MLMNKEQVIDFMPHRAPFLFIDTVTSVDIPDSAKKSASVVSRDLVGSKIVANFKVTKDLEILAGHFPGRPILPGVIQVEMMAQASAFVSLGLNGVDSDDYKVETLLLGVESSKFRKPIVPDMDLEIHAHMDKCRGPIAHYTCEIYCEGKKVSEAKILARLDVVAKDK